MLREKLQQNKFTVFTRQYIIIALVILGVLIASGGGITYYAVSQKPELGAQTVDVLRKIVGDERVAQLEQTVFAVQDSFKQLQYKISGKEPNTPWKVVVEEPSTIITMTPTPVAVEATPNSPSSSQPQPTLVVKPTAVIGRDWPPPALHPIGGIEDEGVWSPYIHDTSGRIVAYRTFLLPDRQRPYAVAAVVAFNLGISQLGFVIGTEEPIPQIPSKLVRTGAIPQSDRQPGVLLATFNGGFKSQHGSFGTMFEGNIILPGRPSMGTLILYKNGKLDIQPWDLKFYDTKEIRSWRQNGPLLIQKDEINPDTFEKSKLVENWGATIDGDTVTWRSGIGLSKNRQFLYYVAGSSLTVPTLANVLKVAGSSDAMQLDINPYWVHFTTVQAVKNKLVTEPLFPEMQNNSDRYLYNYSRDYFYVVAHNPEQ